MTTQEKLVKRKLSILELADFLKNVSQSCKIHGVSRQHFYDIKKAYAEHGIEGLKEKTRRKPCMKNRVAPEVEDAVLKMACEYPAYGQLRASNELHKSGNLPWEFNAPGGAFKLGTEVLRIHLAHLFDPMMAVHTSNVEPLPHQIMAVYESMLPRQPLRFLLADDPRGNPPFTPMISGCRSGGFWVYLHRFFAFISD